MRSGRCGSSIGRCARERFDHVALHVDAVREDPFGRERSRDDAADVSETNDRYGDARQGGGTYTLLNYVRLA